MTVDLRLNAIVDPERSGGHDLADLARLCAQGGATLDSIARQAQRNPRHGRNRARDQTALAPFNVPLVINDRIDVALAAGADGVHVGQDDMAVEDARNLLGRDAIIGLSIKTVAEANAAPVDADRLCRLRAASMSRARSSRRTRRSARKAWRASSPRCMRARRNLPVCGIAGIDASNAAAVIAAGADGIAVISALSLAPDPAAAARALRAIVDATLAKRST